MSPLSWVRGWYANYGQQRGYLPPLLSPLIVPAHHTPLTPSVYKKLWLTYQNPFEQFVIFITGTNRTLCLIFCCESSFYIFQTPHIGKVMEQIWPVASCLCQSCNLSFYENCMMVVNSFHSTQTSRSHLLLLHKIFIPLSIWDVPSLILIKYVDTQKCYCTKTLQSPGFLWLCHQVTTGDMSVSHNHHWCPWLVSKIRIQS